MAKEETNPNVAYFGETDFRGRRTRFGIKHDDRARHMYVIGKTGMGKSTLLENLAIQDIQDGRGLAFIDPHGSTAEKLLDYVPPERVNDVIYFAPFDLDYPISFNVMEDVGEDQRHLVVSGLMSAFKKLFGEESFSDRMQYILQNTLLALLEYPDYTLLGVNRMLTDKAYRNKVVANVTDSSVKAYWTQEFANYTERFAQEATPAIQNKIGQFTSNPLIRNIIGQTKSSFDFRKIMDTKRILIVNLSKGRLGETNSNLLGSMLITKLYLTAMSRANISGPELRLLPPFYLFVDEFQSFANESFANILSEARKYKLSLTIAHQYIEQMAEEVRAAVFGNVGSIITFRVGPFDAEILEKIFFPTFTKEDLVNLGFAQTYLTLMIDGVGSPPFSAVTIAPIPLLQDSQKEKIIEHSRQTYAKPRGAVETEIVNWHAVSKGEAPAGAAAAPRAKFTPALSPATPFREREREPRAAREEGRREDGHGGEEAPRPKPVSLGVLNNRQPEKKILSETEKQKTKEELRQSLKNIMNKGQPPRPSQSESPAPKPPTPPLVSKPETSEPKKEAPVERPQNEVPRDVLEKLLKVD